MIQADLFRPSIVELAERHRAQFPDAFLAYLPDNLHVYAAFKREALAVWHKGYSKYSARTIIEVLRHHSALRENAGGEWKLNDHSTPYLARLFCLENPFMSSLFEFRKTKKVYTEV